MPQLTTVPAAARNQSPPASKGPPKWQPITSFPQFSLLSPEIRLMIWKLHIAGPRIVTICEGYQEVNQRDMPKDIDLDLCLNTIREPSIRDHNPHTDHAMLYFDVPLVIQTIPTLFHICRETRFEAKKIWDTLYFASTRAWELFTRTPTGGLGLFMGRRLLGSEDGHEQPTEAAVAYNAALNTQMLRQYRTKDPDGRLLNEMENTLKYLAFGGSKEITQPRALLGQLHRFWKLKMLLLAKTRGWQFRNRYRRFMLSDANESFLKRHWRVQSAQCKDHDEWLQRKEEFEHISLPRIEYVAESTMKKKLQLNEGFDENFRARPRPPNNFDKLLLM
ncbi:hypothetical protein ACMFMF_001744 [Clarireedia jacksonii]